MSRRDKFSRDSELERARGRPSSRNVQGYSRYQLERRSPPKVKHTTNQSVSLRSRSSGTTSYHRSNYDDSMPRYSLKNPSISDTSIRKEYDDADRYFPQSGGLPRQPLASYSKQVATRQDTRLHRRPTTRSQNVQARVENGPTRLEVCDNRFSPYGINKEPNLKKQSPLSQGRLDYSVPHSTMPFSNGKPGMRPDDGRPEYSSDDLEVASYTYKNEELLRGTRLKNVLRTSPLDDRLAAGLGAPSMVSLSPSTKIIPPLPRVTEGYSRGYAYPVLNDADKLQEHKHSYRDAYSSPQQINPLDYSYRQPLNARDKNPSVDKDFVNVTAHDVREDLKLPRSRESFYSSAGYDPYYSESAKNSPSVPHSSVSRSSRFSPKRNVLSRLGPVVDERPSSNDSSEYLGVEQLESCHRAENAPSQSGISSLVHDSLYSNSISSQERFGTSKCDSQNPSSDVMSRLGPLSGSCSPLDVPSPVDQPLTNRYKVEPDLRETLLSGSSRIPDVLSPNKQPLTNQYKLAPISKDLRETLRSGSSGALDVPLPVQQPLPDQLEGTSLSEDLRETLKNSWSCSNRSLGVSSFVQQSFTNPDKSLLKDLRETLNKAREKSLSVDEFVSALQQIRPGYPVSMMLESIVQAESESESFALSNVNSGSDMLNSDLTHLEEQKLSSSDGLRPFTLVKATESEHPHLQSDTFSVYGRPLNEHLDRLVSQPQAIMDSKRDLPFIRGESTDRSPNNELSSLTNQQHLTSHWQANHSGPNSSKIPCDVNMRVEEHPNYTSKKEPSSNEAHHHDYPRPLFSEKNTSRITTSKLQVKESSLTTGEGTKGNFEPSLVLPFSNFSEHSTSPAKTFQDESSSGHKLVAIPVSFHQISPVAEFEDTDSGLMIEEANSIKETEHQSLHSSSADTATPSLPYRTVAMSIVNVEETSDLTLLSASTPGLEGGASNDRDGPSHLSEPVTQKVETFTNKHLSVPPTRKYVSSSTAELQSTEPRVNNVTDNKIEALARLVVGEELSTHLIQFTSSKNSLFKQLFCGCVTVINCLAWNKNGISMAPQVIRYLKCHLEGFYSSTLKQDIIPANSNILYTKELSQLRSMCGNNVPKWNECIRRFVLLTNMIPTTPDQFEREQVLTEQPSTISKVASTDERKSGKEVESCTDMPDKMINSPPPSHEKISPTSTLPQAQPPLSREMISPTSTVKSLPPENENSNVRKLDLPVVGYCKIQVDSQTVGYHNEDKRPSNIPMNKGIPFAGDLQHDPVEKSEVLKTSCTTSSCHFSPSPVSQQVPGSVQITSSIPVRSSEKTAKGLQSLLDMVQKSVSSSELFIQHPAEASSKGEHAVEVQDNPVTLMDKHDPRHVVNSDVPISGLILSDSQSLVSILDDQEKDSVHPSFPRLNVQYEDKGQSSKGDKVSVEYEGAHHLGRLESNLNEQVSASIPVVSVDSIERSSTGTVCASFSQEKREGFLGDTIKCSVNEEENGGSVSETKLSEISSDANTTSKASAEACRPENVSTSEIKLGSGGSQESKDKGTGKLEDLAEKAKTKQFDLKGSKDSQKRVNVADDVEDEIKLSELRDTKSDSLSPGEIRSPSPPLKVSPKDKSMISSPPCSPRGVKSSTTSGVSRSRYPSRERITYRHSGKYQHTTTYQPRESGASRDSYHPRSEHSHSYRRERVRSPVRSSREYKSDKSRSSFPPRSRVPNKSRRSNSPKCKSPPDGRRSRDGNKRSNRRSRSGSEDDLELLELKKQVIMSMINSDKETTREIATSPKINSINKKTPSPPASKAPPLPPSSVVLEKPPPPPAIEVTGKIPLLPAAETEKTLLPPDREVFSGAKDDLSVVDMEICNTCSESDLDSMITNVEQPVTIDKESTNNDVDGPFSTSQKDEDPKLHMDCRSPLHALSVTRSSNTLAVVSSKVSKSVSNSSSASTCITSTRHSSSASPKSSSSFPETTARLSMAAAKLSSGSKGLVDREKSSRMSSPSFSVKVLPGNEKTWNIETFHIIPESDTETECSDMELAVDSETSRGSEQRQGAHGTSEISQLLVEARKVAERNTAKLKQKSCPKESHDTIVPPLLPTPQKQEYIELKKKLTLYEKRKQLKKKKSQLVSGNKPHVSTNLKKTSMRSPKSQKPKVLPPAEKRIVKSGVKSKRGVSQQPPSAKTSKEKEITACEKKLSTHEGMLEKHRSQRGENQRQINSLTNELTECELHTEESELKIQALLTQIRNLQKQVEAAKNVQNETDIRKGKLQAKVRSAKESFVQNDKKVQESEIQVSRIKTALAKLNNSIAHDGGILSVPTPQYEVISDSESSTNVRPENKNLSCVKEVASGSDLRSSNGRTSGCGSKDERSVPVSEHTLKSISSLNIPQIIVEPVSDAEDETSCSPYPSPSINIEPISDNEVSEMKEESNKPSGIEDGGYPLQQVVPNSASSKTTVALPRFTLIDVEAISDSESVSGTSPMVVDKDTSAPSPVGVVHSVESVTDSQSLALKENSFGTESPLSQLYRGAQIQWEHSYCKSISTDSSSFPATTSVTTSTSLPSTSPSLPSMASPLSVTKLNIVDTKLSPLGDGQRLPVKGVHENTGGKKGNKDPEAHSEMKSNSEVKVPPDDSHQTVNLPPKQTESMKPALVSTGTDNVKAEGEMEVDEEYPPVVLNPAKRSDSQLVQKHTHSTCALTSAQNTAAPDSGISFSALSSICSHPSSPRLKVVIHSDDDLPTLPESISQRGVAATNSSSAECTPMGELDSAEEPSTSGTFTPTQNSNDSAPAVIRDPVSGIVNQEAVDECSDQPMLLGYSDRSSLDHNQSHLDVDPEHNIYIHRDQIFHCGTDELFTLGTNVAAEYVVPLANLDLVFSLEVDPSCISTTALKDIQKRSVRSFVTRTGSGETIEDTVLNEEDPSHENDVESDVSVPEQPDSQVPVPGTPSKLCSEVPVPSTPPKCHSQVPIPDTPPKHHSQVPIPGTPPKHHSQVPIPGTPPKHHSQVPIPDTPPKHHSQVPITDTPPKHHSQAQSPDMGKSSSGRSRKQKKPHKLTPEVKKRMLLKDDSAVSSVQEGVATGAKTDSSTGKVSKRNIEEKLQKHVEKLEYLKGQLASRMIDSRADGPSQKSEKSKIPDKDRKRKRAVQVQDDSSGKLKKHRRNSTSGEQIVTDSMAMVSEQPQTKTSEISDVLTDNRDVEQAVKFLNAAFEQSLPGTTHLSVEQIQHLLNSSDQASSCSSVQYTTSCRPLTLLCLSPSSMTSNTQEDSKATKVKLAPGSLLTMNSKSVPRSNSIQSASFVPYNSPLLTFSSYRFNPAYRNYEKLEVGSLTYSNKLDPKQILCKFETLGICRDPKCTAQHLRDVQLSKEEVVTNLVSHAPGLAGCTPEELFSAETSHPQSQKEVASKISNFAASVVERYSSKLSDEEIYSLTTHVVNKGRKSRTSGTSVKRSYISFDNRHWLSNPSPPGNETSKVRVRSQTFPSGAGTSVSGMELLSLEWNGELSLETDSHQDLKRKTRYFTKASSAPVDGTKSGEKHISQYIELSNRALRQGKYEDCVASLESGLEKQPASEELWVLRLRAHSHYIRTQGSLLGGQSLDDLCNRAMSSTQSYAVVLECLSVTTSYAKLKWIREGFKMLVGLPVTMTTSHQCLELLLNLVFLDVSLGRLDVAMGTMDMVLFGKKDEPSSSYLEGVLKHFTPDDKMMACICSIHLMYWSQLPSCVFDGTMMCATSFPSMIISKKPFCIQWDPNKQLIDSQCAKLREMFKNSLQLCQTADSASLHSNVQLCLPLYASMFSFEVAHGDSPQRASQDIEALLVSSPEVVELWLLNARIQSLIGASPRTVLMKATSVCPQSAELHFLAAKMELSNITKDMSAPSSHGMSASSSHVMSASSSHGMSASSSHGMSVPSRHCDVTSAMQRAVGWLEKCVKAFYKIPSDVQDSELSIETVLLYRKLLGLLIPYDVKIPEFADGVHLKELGKQLAPLWMCYCLLVELTTPNSPSSEFYHQTAADAYESAIHSMHVSDDCALLWRAYLSFLQSSTIMTANNVEIFKVFLSCTRRCMLAVDHSATYTHAVYGRAPQYEDYSFHNEMLELFFSSLQFTPAQKLSLLQSFGSLLPNNPHLIAMTVDCALEQTPQHVELAQSVLATYLSKFPTCGQLWKLAISTELLLNHSKEARWMYQQAVDALPHDINLWRDFLVFELKEMMNNPHQGQPVSPLVNSLLQRAQDNGVDFQRAVPNH